MKPGDVFTIDGVPIAGVLAETIELDLRQEGDPVANAWPPDAFACGLEDRPAFTIAGQCHFDPFFVPDRETDMTFVISRVPRSVSWLVDVQSVLTGRVFVRPHGLDDLTLLPIGEHQHMRRVVVLRRWTAWERVVRRTAVDG